MSALKAARNSRRGAAIAGVVRALPVLDHLVLPRLLRRPARFVARVFGGDYTPPRFAAGAATALLLSGFALYGAVLGGHLPPAVQAATSRAGFAVDQVRVTGHVETSEIDVLERLGLDGWTSLIGFDADAARLRLGELPWVETVAVRKIYPDTIEVAIAERQPFAIWQHGTQLTIVDSAGGVIVPYAGGRHATLPLVIGYGAGERAAAFVEKVARHPELAARVKGYIRIAERRWDLRLENGITVKLPEGSEDMAIAEVLKLDRETGILSRDIASVDLRLDDRISVQLTPEAALRREAALKEQAKARRKTGKNT